MLKARRRCRALTRPSCDDVELGKSRWPYLALVAVIQMYGIRVDKTIPVILLQINYTIILLGIRQSCPMLTGGRRPLAVDRLTFFFLYYQPLDASLPPFKSESLRIEGVPISCVTRN